MGIFRVEQPYLINPPTRGGNASLVNRVQPKAEARVMERKEKSNMAKRKKLYGAAAAAHAKKAGKSRKAPAKRRKARKAAPAKRRRARKSTALAAAPRKSKRRRHLVKRYHRKGGRVSSYSRRGANVKKHWSNPMNFGGVAMEGLIAAGAILGTLFVVGYANGKLQHFKPTSSGYGNLAGKFALAVGAGLAASYAHKKRWVSKETAYAMTGAAMAPLLLAGVSMLSPQLAAGVTLAGCEGESAMPMIENVFEQGAVGAELQAQLEAELRAEEEDLSSI